MASRLAAGRISGLGRVQPMAALPAEDGFPISDAAPQPQQGDLEANLLAAATGLGPIARTRGDDSEPARQRRAAAMEKARRKVVKAMGEAVDSGLIPAFDPAMLYGPPGQQFGSEEL